MPSCIKKNLSRLINQLELWLPNTWRSISWPQLLLLPITLFFYLLVQLRRLLYAWHVLPSFSLSVPVVVIGNLTVGGTGKTPLTIALANHLKNNGYKPGVVSRGYGRKSNQIMPVEENGDFTNVGDEPLLIAANAKVPVYVGSNRVEAAKSLLRKHTECNVIICDDGLQHYRLGRNYEIIVVDGLSGFGNGLLLPAGPLREPRSRAKAANAIVVNGGFFANNLQSELQHKTFEMQLVASPIYQLIDPDVKFDIEGSSDRVICAVAGIGNPGRFFKSLDNLGLAYEKMPYPDHYEFSHEDFLNIKAEVILITEKDAVKCRDFADSRFWVLPVTAELDDAFFVSLKNAIKKKGKSNGF